ncbi:MAG: pentapeptide repeat-containing protein [Phycisphaera sp.]|nr:MAG: pentapeptide repeat-containing protein [Phycisphaera sp.]
MADEPPTSPPTPPPTSPDETPAFVAGLPEGPPWRPMCYDGPLVCPFYGPDHPARRDEESTEAFNEDVARRAFGDETFDRLARNQLHQPIMNWGLPFRGDWWLLVLLHYEIERANALDPSGSNQDRYASLTALFRVQRGSGIQSHLEFANLSEAHLQFVNLSHVHLQHSNLYSTDLEHAYLGDARLEYANFSQALLQHASLYSTHLEHAYLGGASLDHGHYHSAYFEHAYLGYASLEHADLTSTHFEHANLCWASLDHADVRHASGLLVYANLADRLHIEGAAPDPWSVLRRTYTGPRYALHLLLTLAFLLPFVVSVSNLGAIDRAYTAIAEATPRPAFEPRLGDLPGAGTHGVAEPRVENLSHGELRRLVERFDRHHAPTPAWWVLVGGLEAWYFAILTAIVAAYNVVRLVVMLGAWRWLVFGAGDVNTAGVTALREAEERSRVTPSLEDYYGPLHPLSATYKRRVLGFTGEDDNELQPSEHEPARAARLWREWLWMASCWLRYDKNFPLMAIGLYRLHCIARVLFWLAVAAFVFRAAHWVLTATVPAPIDALL